MRNNIFKKLLLLSAFALAIVSCSEEEPNNSIVTVFTPTPVTLDAGTPAIVVSETDEGTYTFDFALDGESQLTDITIEIGVGTASTATEGVDFTLDTDEVDILALGGQDGFSVDITVLEDFDAEAGDEDIYLTFTTTDPSGVQSSETKVITIEDSGLQKDLSFTLRWASTTPEVPEADGTEPCDMDFDFTIQPQGEAPYDSDLLGYEMAVAHCPESSRMFASDMVDGVVYDLWFIAYGPGINYGDFGLLDVSLDFERLGTDFKGTYELPGEDIGFQYAIDGDGAGAPLATIVRNGDVLTLMDYNGVIVGEGLIAGNGPALKTGGFNKPN